MELEHIIEFVALADTLNYHRAADKLFISQSSLSKHIKTLERDLNVPLFERNVSGVLLTDFGRLFYPYANQIARLYEDYQADATLKLSSLRGSVSLGTEYDISRLLCAFKTEYPDFSVKVFDNPASKLVKRGLRVGEFELAVLHDDEESNREFNSIPFFTDRLVLAVSAKDILAKKGDPVLLASLKDKRFIFPSEQGMLNQIIMRVCHERGLSPISVCTGLSIGRILDLVGADVGVALVPRLEAETRNTPNVCLLELERECPIKLNLYFRKNSEFTPGAMSFISFLQKYRQQKYQKGSPEQ